MASEIEQNGTTSEQPIKGIDGAVRHCINCGALNLTPALTLGIPD